MNAPLNLYFYRVLLPHGKVDSGFMKAVVEREHSIRLRLETRTSGTVIALKRLPSWLLFIYEFPQKILRRNVQAEDLTGFLRDTGVMLKAGVPALEAVKTLAEDNSGSAGVSEIARNVSEDLVAGMRIPQSFNRHPDIFPEAVRNLADIGDRSGEMSKMLIESASHIERLTAIRRDITTALIYPIIVMLTISGVGLFWLYYVVPNMALLFKQMNAKLPPLTKWLISVSDVLVNYVFLSALLFVLLIVMVIAAYNRIPKFRQKVHEALHALPVTGKIVTASGMAFMTEHLSILVKAGIDFISSIDILARATTDQYYRVRLLKIRDGVARGEGIGAAMRRVGGFPSMVVRMISIGEESGSIDEQLDQLAEEYKKRLDILVRTLSEILKPVLILIAGGMFIFLVVALLLPIYDLVRQASGGALGR